MREIFANTQDGLLYDAEFQIFDYVFSQFQPGDLRFTTGASNPPLVQPSALSPSLVGSIIGVNNALAS